MTKKETVRRLTVLRNTLSKVKGGRYSHGHWQAPGPQPRSLKQALECGSPACALGWACRIPQFKAMGLGPVNPSVENFTPYYRGYNGVAAGARLFGLSSDDARRLFSCYQDDGSIVRDRTVKEEIALIDQIIDEYSPRRKC